MRKMDIEINAKRYKIACDIEQSDHVHQLVDEVDSRAKELAKSMPNTNEATILIFTCLMLADELYEARQEAGALHERILYDQNDLGDVLPRDSSMEANKKLTQMMHNVSGTLEELTQQIEKL